MKEKSFLSEVSLPQDIRSKIESSKLLFSKSYKRNRCDELHELVIHVENSKASGITIFGGSEAIEKLKKSVANVISIYAGKNNKYFFKVYIDKENDDDSCYILIERRLHN